MHLLSNSKQEREMMHVVDQHHDYLEEQCCNGRDTVSIISVSISQVAFVLAAIACLSWVSLSSVFGAFSGAALSATRQLLAASCGFVMTKKALFILSNAIFLFLAADCSCYFGTGPMAPTKSDGHHSAAALQPCAVQVAQACGSYSNTTRAPENCSEEQEKRQDVPVSSTPEPFRLEGDEANGVTFLETVVIVVEEPTCSGVAQELEKLEIDELNRKFEEFIQSRRIKWIKEEEEEVLQCQQV